MENFIDKLKLTLEVAAPTLAGALGGPLAAMVVTTLEKSFGCTGDDLISKISAPESQPVLNQISDEKLKIDEVDQSENDIENARKSNNELKFNEWMVAIISIIFLFSGLGVAIFTLLTPNAVDKTFGARIATGLILPVSIYWLGRNYIK